MGRTVELDAALDVERQLRALLVRAPILCELPIAPLRGVDDLVRLELVLQRFAEVHRSKRSRVLVGRVRRILDEARGRLRVEAAIDGSASYERVEFSDTRPA